MRRPVTSRWRAFSLIELMIVVLIIMLSSAIGINTFGRYIRKVKTLEATGGVESIFRAVIAYNPILMNMNDDSGNLAFDWDNAATKPFPYLYSENDGGTPAVPCDKQKIYFFNPPNCTHDPTCDWQAWRDVGAGFDSDYLRYRFLVIADDAYATQARNGESRSTFQVAAEGDLNCDGNTSAFVRSGWLGDNGVIGTTDMRISNELD